MPDLVAILSHTPFYVWLLLAAFIALGVKATQSRTTALWRALALPIVFLALAISHIFGAGSSNLVLALAGLFLGGGAGWLLVGPGGARRLPDGRIWLKGEWLSLVIMLAEFAQRYVEAVARATAPAHEINPVLASVLTFTGVCLSALAVGRWGARLRAYFASIPAASAPEGAPT